MTALSITTPYPLFAATDGTPVDNGYVYIGTANQNPETNQITAYWDAALTVPATQPIRTLAGYPSRNGAASNLYVDATDYSMTLRDNHGTLVFNIPSVEYRLNAGQLGGLNASAIQYTPGGTGAVNTTVQAKLRETVSVTDFGAVGDGVTTDTTALQAALNHGGTIYVPAGTYKSGELTASVANTTLILDKGATLHFPTLGANKHGITVTANYFSIKGGKLSGPVAVTNVSNECGLYMVGTSTSVRKSGLTVDNVEMTGFGMYGIYAQFVNTIKITNNNVHDTRMHGVCFLSCNDITETGNWIHDIDVGNDTTAYGFIHSHDSTDYNLDPDSATNGRLAVHPFCIGLYCAGNVIENIAWEGIDCHGVYDANITANRVYNTKLGISAPSSSGDATNYAGEQNIVHGNLITSYKRDGSVGDNPNAGYGINLNGGSTVNNRRIVCTDNILIGKGEISTSGGGAIRAAYCMHVLISGNIIHDWGGQCIYTINSIGTIANNIFGGMASAIDTYAQCIRLDGTTDMFSVLNNKHWYADKSFASKGLSVLSTNTYRHTLSGNDFAPTTTPFEVTAYQVLGSDVTPMLEVTGSGTTVDIAALKGWNGVVNLSANATHNVANISNIKNGQEVMFIKTGTGTVTFVRTGSPGLYLDGGTDKTVTGKNVIIFRESATYIRQTGYSTAA